MNQSAETVIYQLDLSKSRLPKHPEDRKDFVLDIPITDLKNIVCADDERDLLLNTLERDHYCDVPIAIVNSDSKKQISGRALFCHAAGIGSRRAVSVCIRLKKTVPAGTTKELTLKSRPKRVFLSEKRNSKFLFDLDELCDVIGAHVGLLPPPRTEQSDGNFWNASGLLVVAGATKCCKTNISKGIVLKYLWQNPVKQKSEHRFPHIISVEDPIEPWTFYGSNSYSGKRSEQSLDIHSAEKLGIRFTPRSLGNDTSSLSAAVMNALRQTPRCFYIGEIRCPDDWKPALQLASTGHLVVTTTHASTLAETFTRIFNALEARDEPTRAIAVNSLRGVVHLRSTREIAPFNNDDQVFPSIWSATPQSRASVINDGIAAIVPDAEVVFGRRMLAKELFQLMKYRTRQISNKTQCAALAWSGVRDVLGE